MDVIWTNSGDSHFMEPPDLFKESLPPSIASRLPWSEPDGEQYELVHIDGKVIRRRLPSPRNQELHELMSRPAGAKSVQRRLEDLDGQGVWAEVVFPSLGLWYGEIEDASLVDEAAKVLNSYIMDEMSISPRFVPTATLPLQSIEMSVAELQRTSDLGFKAIFLPTSPPPEREHWNDDAWEPLWSAADEAHMVLAFHIGTDAGGPFKFRGPGGALINYVETTFGGQRAVVQMVGSGVLERHPNLKVLVSEGGATWAPFVGDRMNECFRQQPMFHDNRLTLLPKEYVLRQVYATFQHDETAIPTIAAMGFNNVLFGTDYPHLEGTFPHTQQVLHGLLDGVEDAVRDRVTTGSFFELFPDVPRPTMAEQSTLLSA